MKPTLLSLARVEVFGMSSAIPLVIYSRYVITREVARPINKLPLWLKVAIAGVATTVGLVITWFASDAALQSPI